MWIPADISGQDLRAHQRINYPFWFHWMLPDIFILRIHPNGIRFDSRLAAVGSNVV